MDESQMHDAKSKNPHTENIHTLWFSKFTSENPKEIIIYIYKDYTQLILRE